MNELIFKNIKKKFSFKKAFKNDEFILYYQPLIDINTMHIYGMESLLRWNHPDRGILPPKYFIDTIEQNGLICDIGRFVFIETCKQLKRNQNFGYRDITASINICKKQLEDRLFVNFVYDTLKSQNIEPEYICLEITERVFINHSDEILNTLNSLKKMGIRLFIDDFGTKYSSLSYLRRFPFDGIKIDASFVRNIQDSRKSLIITKNIINLAYELNLDVVAEGVENLKQLNCLKKISCHKIQGYLFGVPACSDKFVTYLNKYNSQNTEKVLTQ